MNSASPRLQTIRIKSHQAHAEAGRFRLLGARFDNARARDMFAVIANSIQQTWRNGWRRVDGTSASEFVVYLWTSTDRTTGKSELVVRMGLDLAIPAEFASTPERSFALAA